MPQVKPCSQEDHLFLLNQLLHRLAVLFVLRFSQAQSNSAEMEASLRTTDV